MKFLSRRGLTPEQLAKLNAAVTRPIYLRTFTTPSDTYAITPQAGYGNVPGEDWEQDYKTGNTLVLGSVVFDGLYGSATATYTVGLRLNGQEVARANLNGAGGAENRTLHLPAGLVWNADIDTVTLFGTATGDSPWVRHVAFNWNGTPIQQQGGVGQIVSFVTVQETIQRNTIGPLDPGDFPRTLTDDGLEVGAVAFVEADGYVKRRVSAGAEGLRSLAWLDEIVGSITPEQVAAIDSIPGLAAIIANLQTRGYGVLEADPDAEDALYPRLYYTGLDLVWKDGEGFNHSLKAILGLGGGDPGGGSGLARLVKTGGVSVDFFDTFDRADGALGSDYTLGDTLAISSGDVVNTANTESSAHLVGASFADGRVGVVSNRGFMLRLRVQGGSLNTFLVAFWGTDGRLVIARVINGGYGELNSVGFGLTDAPAKWEFEAIGDSIKLYRDGVLAVSVASNAVTGAGLCGFGVQQTSAAPSARVQSFTATAAGNITLAGLPSGARLTTGNGTLVSSPVYATAPTVLKVYNADGDLLADELCSPGETRTYST